MGGKILAHLQALITAILAVPLGAIRVEIYRPNVSGIA